MAQETVLKTESETLRRRLQTSEDRIKDYEKEIQSKNAFIQKSIVENAGKSW